MTAVRALVASVALADLFDGLPRRFQVAHRGRTDWPLADHAGRITCCLMFPGSVRFPHGLALPEPPPTEIAAVRLGAGRFTYDDTAVPVTRWFRPAAPHHPALSARVRPGAVDRFFADWRKRLGRGDGLTPYDDDVLVGALVALHAAGSPAAAGWSAEIASSRLEDATTATSAGLLRAATEGRCLDEVAAVLAAYDDRPGQVDAAEQRLLGLGHSSGHGLLEGICLTLGRPGSRRAVA